VKAFSIGFEEERFNELRYAAIAARKFQADHRHLHRQRRRLFRSAAANGAVFDEPFANSSAIPTCFCAKLAAANGVRISSGSDLNTIK